ncbi:MAG: hypothetical protein UZ22_OP11002000817 [Microgenomates bacterium OLB23]|nr:MAG: hypothetical protein UZ22_OP11002000817 [Microgenomates bacterium OLB23]
MFFIRYLARIVPIHATTYILLSVAMLTSGKMFPFWLVIAGFVMTRGFEIVLQEIKTRNASTKRFNIVIAVLLGFAIANGLIVFTATQSTYAQLAEDVYYPQKGGCIFKKPTRPQDNIFAPFGWGGYLIWNLPQHRIFISGLMPHWGNILNEYTSIIALESPFKKAAAPIIYLRCLFKKIKQNSLN